MDEVDRILQAWARETPDLDVSPLRVLSRVSRLARHLDFERRDAFAIHSLDTWEFDVLAALAASAPDAVTFGWVMTALVVPALLGVAAARSIGYVANHSLAPA